MTILAARQAARLLTEQRLARTQLPSDLPSSCRPGSRAEAYAIQTQILSLSGLRAYGWKIAATSTAGQSHIGVDGPLAGRLHVDQVQADGTSVDLRGNLLRVAELEFAFTIGRTLWPHRRPFSVGQVMNAVASLHPAIEIPDTRFQHFLRAGAAQLTADGACCDRFILGPAAPRGWTAVDLSTHAVTGLLRREGQPPATLEGIGRNVLGDPRLALTWLANELAEHGIALHAGEVVTTGTCVVPIAIASGDRLQGDFGAIGRVWTQFFESSRR